jgi:hypothetical protein
MIRKLHPKKSSVLMPKAFKENISFVIPAKRLKGSAHRGLKKRLAIITQIKSRSGFTRNIWAQLKIVASSSAETIIAAKIIQGFMG